MSRWSVPSSCASRPAALLLKTGQTTSYREGDDGDLQKGIALGYVDNGDGTITDTKTGIMWEKLSDGGSIHDKDQTYTWGNAFPAKVAQLNQGGGFAGYTDWRLPNAKELHSIVNLQNANPSVSPAFNSGCAPVCTVLTCSCTVSSYYWSSSTVASIGGGGSAWFVHFYDGFVSGEPKSFPHYVRAVRGGS